MLTVKPKKMQIYHEGEWLIDQMINWSINWLLDRFTRLSIRKWCQVSCHKHPKCTIVDTCSLSTRRTWNRATKRLRASYHVCTEGNGRLEGVTKSSPCRRNHQSPHNEFWYNFSLVCAFHGSISDVVIYFSLPYQTFPKAPPNYQPTSSIYHYRPPI